jgi:hypothetical protein
MMTEASEMRDADAPSHAGWRAALVYFACTMSLSWPALLGRSLLDESSDQFRAGVAFRQFAADYFKQNGGFPLWNPFLQGGMPFVAAMHGDTFYPTFLLRLVMPVGPAIAWGMIAHFFLCGMATYWFLRVAGRLSFTPAVVGGVAYMMTGFVSSLISPGHDGKLFVNALFPVVLLLITWAVRDGKQWAFGTLAAAVGLMLLTPHPQLFEQGMVIAGGWALYLAFRSGEGALDRPAAIKRLALAGAAVAVGVAIGAIQYLPVVEYEPWSPRAGGLGYQTATSFSFPIEELFNLYLPQFSGILTNYWGRNGIHFHSEYAGVAVLMLAGAAFGAKLNPSRKSFVRFWIGAAIVSLLWALGGNTPFFQLVYAIVPKVKSMRAPSTMFFVTAFSLAVLAAAGTQRLIGQGISRKYLIGWAIAAAGVALLALGGALTNMAHSLVMDPRLADRVDAGAGDLKVGAIRSLAFALLTVGLMTAIAGRRLKGSIATFALAALCALDLWTVDRLYWRWGPPADQLFATDPIIDRIKQDQQPARVMTLAFQGAPLAPNDAYLAWDGLMAHGIRQTYGYHGNELARYQVFNANEMYFNPTTWALTNTKYLMTNDSTLGTQGLTRVMGPVPNAAGTPVTLYELPGDHPFAWVAPAIVKYPDDELLKQIRAPTFPARQVALIDPSSSTPAANISVLPPASDITVATTAYAPGKISLALSAPATPGSALVVSENYYPGWVAEVDGKPVATERTDLVLIGIPLPAGARNVELRFTSPAYQKGKVITLVAVAIAVLWWLAGAIRPRQAEVAA